MISGAAAQETAAGQVPRDPRERSSTKWGGPCKGVDTLPSRVLWAKSHLTFGPQLHCLGCEAEKQNGWHICGGIATIRSHSFIGTFQVLDTEVSIRHTSFPTTAFRKWEF